MTVPDSTPGAALGARIRRLRERYEMSIHLVAIRARVAAEDLRQIEGGTVDVDLNSLIRIAHAIGTDPGVLLSGLRPSAEATPPTAPRRLVAVPAAV